MYRLYFKFALASNLKYKHGFLYLVKIYVSSINIR